MVISAAVRNNIVSLSSGCTQYKTNVILVSQYVSGVMNTSLPVLLNPVPDWNTYETAYVAAKSSAMAWVNTVLEKLNTVPNTIVGYNDAVHTLFGNAIQNANTLIANPTDPSARMFLLNDINSAISNMNFFESQIAGVITTLQSFKESLPQQASNLQAIANAATKDQRADQDQISALSQKIDEANAEIKSLTAAIVGLAIVDGVAIVLGVVAVAVAGPIGMITWIFLGAAVAVASIYIAIDATKIKALKDQIEAYQKSMSSFTADVAALTNTANIFKQFADQAQAIEDNLQQILDAWSTLKAELTVVQNELHTASSDYTQEKWQSVKTDFENALADWNTFVASVGQLDITVQGNTAKLQLGMSSAEVQAAMTAGQTTDFITYINQAA